MVGFSIFVPCSDPYISVSFVVPSNEVCPSVKFATPSYVSFCETRCPYFFLLSSTLLNPIAYSWIPHPYIQRKYKEVFYHQALIFAP